MLSPWKPSRDLSRYFSMVNETLTKLFTPIERTSNSFYLLSLYLFLGFLGFKNGCGLMLVQCDSHKHLKQWMNQTARLIQLPSVEILTVSLATCVKDFWSDPGLKLPRSGVCHWCFLPPSDVICDLNLNERKATWDLFVSCDKKAQFC